MGLIGGVKGWMQGSSRRNLSDSRAPSPSNSGEDDSPEAKSPVEQAARGRRGRPAGADVDVEMSSSTGRDAPSEQLVAETKEASVGRS
jgi:choline-phosphate cytidylyltransferase